MIIIAKNTVFHEVITNSGGGSRGFSVSDFSQLFAYHFTISQPNLTNEVSLETLSKVILGSDFFLKLHYNVIQNIDFQKNISLATSKFVIYTHKKRFGSHRDYTFLRRGVHGGLF